METTCASQETFVLCKLFEKHGGLCTLWEMPSLENFVWGTFVVLFNLCFRSYIVEL